MITGASSGIGAAAAHCFAEEGASVVLMARREDRLRALAGEIEETGGQVAVVTGDVTNQADVDRAVDVAVAEFGTLDAAFNNAGQGTLGAPLHETEQAVFDRIMDVNVRGVWNCLRAQIRTMLTQGTGGAIVNTSSTAGLFATGAVAPYVAAKHAVLGLTKTAAAEYGDHGIRVNALVVGATRTDMVTSVLQEVDGLREADLVARPSSAGWPTPSRSLAPLPGSVATRRPSSREEWCPWTGLVGGLRASAVGGSAVAVSSGSGRACTGPRP
ncbi:short-chain dehydrogenase [Streptomyces noursei]|uniref:Short-chain dehydrogenase n=1 Tax=Streptomyces noursei TaxID=1971 RepID=A0A401RDT9_STRNR|nr:short-chain dehydrogenase [Streptomyces noursei]